MILTIQSTQQWFNDLINRRVYIDIYYIIYSRTYDHKISLNSPSFINNNIQADNRTFRPYK